jgi:hypothetical protein
MKMGISAYLRNLAERCYNIAAKSTEIRIQEALGALSVELAEVAENTEVAFYSSEGQPSK